ncbi:MAG TPA: hypothetical protein VNF70_05750 [Pyrinomonadaceae bacterium]|nr:hypothetical protein [Pyrinomonadaceae bacterium]
MPWRKNTPGQSGSANHAQLKAGTILALIRRAIVSRPQEQTVS